MRRYLFIAYLAEFLSWLPLALGFVVGVVVMALVVGYQTGAALVRGDALAQREGDEDDE